MVHQALADYYTAARDREKAQLELTKIAELRPEDAALRIRIADQLVRDGQAERAIEYYKAAFKKEPRLLASTSLIRIQTTLLEAGKAELLLELLESVDVSSIAPLFVSRAIDALPSDPKISERVVALFRKTWAAFPQDHAYILSYVRTDDIWQIPEMYNYAREACIPKDNVSADSMTWATFNPMSVQPSLGAQASKVRMTKPVVLRLVELALKLGKIDELAAEIKQARKKMPSWTAGDFLLAMVLCRSGKYREAEALVRSLPETMKKKVVGVSLALLFYAYHTLGVEVEQTMATSDLAAKLYENAMRRHMLTFNSGWTTTRRRCVVWSTCIGAIGVLRMRGAPC